MDASDLTPARFACLILALAIAQQRVEIDGVGRVRPGRLPEALLCLCRYQRTKAVVSAPSKPRITQKRMSFVPSKWSANPAPYHQRQIDEQRSVSQSESASQGHLREARCRVDGGLPGDSPPIAPIPLEAVGMDWPRSIT